MRTCMAECLQEDMEADRHGAVLANMYGSVEADRHGAVPANLHGGVPADMVWHPASPYLFSTAIYTGRRLYGRTGFHFIQCGQSKKSEAAEE